MVRRLAALALPNGQGAPANTAIDRRKEGGGDVYEKSLEMRRLPDLSVPGGGRVGPSRSAGVGSTNK